MSSITRRHFARKAVALAGAAVILPEALAQTSPPSVDTPAPSPAPPPSPEAEARIAWILGRHGERLSPEQRADIRRLVTVSQAGFDDMRAWPLDNSVEPATPFRIWRADRDGTTAKRKLRPSSERRREEKR